MSGPTGPGPLLIATWANEERIAREGEAERDRAHIAEDRDAAIARGRVRPSRSLLGRLIQAIAGRRR
jgi:hypothetical protein